jgi:choice-of-anchor C domain-containing protein
MRYGRLYISAMISALGAVTLVASGGSPSRSAAADTSTLVQAQSRPAAPSARVSVQRAFSPRLANLLTNGSFEQGVDPGGNTNQFPGSTNVTGWLIVGGTVGYEGAGGWMAEDGVRSLDLDGLSPGGIEQSFVTRPFRRYAVSFWLAGNPDLPADPIKHLGVLIVNGNTSLDFQATYTFDITGKSRSNMGWTQISFRFMARSEHTTIVFASQDQNNEGRGPALDNVSVTASP